MTYNNLFIIDATPEDSGVYMCSAKNLLGQVTQQCEINIKNSTATVSKSVNWARAKTKVCYKMLKSMNQV